MLQVAIWEEDFDQLFKQLQKACMVDANASYEQTGYNFDLG